MRKISINGLELECDDNVEISIEGTKVTVKAAPAEKIVHEHHYHCNTTVTSPPWQPYIGAPYWPNTKSWGENPEPPFTTGLVTVGEPPAAPFGGGTAAYTVPNAQVSDNLARFIQ